MRTSKIFTGTAMMVAVLLVSAGLAIAAPPAGVGVQGQAGNSNVYHCDLLANLADAGDGYGWGKVHVKDLGDSVEFTVNLKGLEPGAEYELRSGGQLNPVVSGVANRGGNLTLVGAASTWGARFNIWDGVAPAGTRIMRTAEGCTPTT